MARLSKLVLPVLTGAGGIERREYDAPPGVRDVAGLLSEFYTVVHAWDEGTNVYVLLLPEPKDDLPGCYFRVGAWHAFTSEVGYSHGYRKVLELLALATDIAKLRIYQTGAQYIDQFMQHIAERQ